MSAGSDKDKGSGALTPRDATVATAQHTPGPWEWDWFDGGANGLRKVLVAPPEVGSVRLIVDMDDPANQALIAAAPKLLRALENAQHAMQYALNRLDGDLFAKKIEATLRAAQLAIDKATQPPAKAGEAKQ